MSKLFVFGIGGTGSRVLKSLTMLLTAGIKTNVDEIIPIIIDKDETNGDTVRTKRLIEVYMSTREKFVHDRDKFFSTKMTLLRYELEDKLCLPLVDKQKKFSDYIEIDKLPKEDRALVEALFSKKALDMETTEGFRGIPSIGSVVLNQFEKSDIFNTFANQFKKGDKIFIISSIFGGTGASGFPLLVKTLRGNTNLTNWDSVQKAPIGALSVLPYFIVGKPNEKGKVNVESDTFNAKAKAALAYYAETLDGQIDEMYYVGDKKFSTYAYSAGGSKQQNHAQFTELVAALSVIDFANSSIVGTSGKTSYNEFGIIDPQHSKEKIIFSDLHKSTRKIIVNPLIQFYAYSQYMELEFDKENTHQPWSHNFPWQKPYDFDKEFKQSAAMQDMQECIKDFIGWLKELADTQSHKRCFVPFNLESKSFAFVYEPSDNIAVREGSLRYKNWAWLDNELNRASARKATQVSESMTKEQRFLEIFYRSTKKFVEELIPNSQDN
ncbi:MAG: hypothetical protein NC038_00020 [Paludibacter sp.]|nr:hypothetical protein [Bacteroidales bacterium]MCM1068775.1 hypothetical protein [Prevotella sp.]MCM1354487.1 hypothetical protein [Bacteroides sp.]MCM1443290.1 hypothetical protein [Muribaculum sp.]MCM1481025.1 hypothetical protein [Paludibacter sp.]